VINILLLEDEHYTREFLKKLLLESPLVSQVFDTASGKEAVFMAKEYPIAIGLFDIELEGHEAMNGLEVARIIHAMCPDMDMIFITGYSKYAIDSFSVHPFDYLLKPVNRQKLMESIHLLANKRLGMERERLIVRSGNETLFIPYESILFMEKLSNRIIIHTTENEYTSISTLGEVEKILPNYFFRAHKSYIVNRNWIKKLVSIGNRSYEIHFLNSSKVALMSRYKYYELKDGFIPTI